MSVREDQLSEKMRLNSIFLQKVAPTCRKIIILRQAKKLGNMRANRIFGSDLHLSLYVGLCKCPEGAGPGLM